MNWLIWNIRGFNCPLKQKEVKIKVKKLNVNLVCLVETRVREEKTGEIMNSFLPGWKFCFLSLNMVWEEFGLCGERTCFLYKFAKLFLKPYTVKFFSFQG